MVGVAVIGFHVEFGRAGVAGFLQRLEERVVVGGETVIGFDDEDWTRF